MSGQTTTDFTHEWANRHDGECECVPFRPSIAIDCHCYRRWLEGRLGEMTAALHEIRQLLYHNWSDNPKWRDGNEHTWVGKADLVAERALLSPKGAGDE